LKGHGRKQKYQRENLYDLKLVEKCKKCKKKLGKFHKHHYLCDNCWKKKQEDSGNLMLIPGVRVVR